MAKTKALRDKENATAAALVRTVLDVHFPGRGGQTRFGAELGLSQDFISDVANEKKGVGINILRGLARYRPVEVVKLLGIKLETLRAHWSDGDWGELMADDLPESMRRVARAAVELWGVTPDAAAAAANEALKTLTDDPDSMEVTELLYEVKRKLRGRPISSTRVKAQSKR
jgi:hypothetical protein